MRITLTLLIFLLAPTLFASGFDSSPAAACQWMSDASFRGSNDYAQRRNGQYRCTSIRKPINQGEPIGSNVRYVVAGTDSAVSEVRLEMQMRAYRQPQQALKKFQEYVTLLMSKAITAELPPAATTSLMAGIVGEWSVAGHTVSLKRVQDYGSSYDYYFIIK